MERCLVSSITVALFAFVCIFGGALLGLLLRAFLPDDHLSKEGKDVVKLGAGLIATLAALVLGLLVSSAKSSLDTMNSELTQSSAKVIALDRVLANYGPETKEVRDLLRGNFTTAIDLIWPEEKTRQARVDNAEVASGIERIQDKLRELSPRNDSQRLLQTQALQMAADVAQARWLLIEQTQSPLPKTFLIVLIFWLTMLFVSFGMLAPRNATVIAVLLVCALSVSGAIFLILEMNTPLTGMIKVSSAPLHKALDHLGK
jgi:hypothetical protein